jgi:hypothetical protein
MLWRERRAGLQGLKPLFDSAYDGGAEAPPFRIGHLRDDSYFGVIFQQVGTE